MKRKIALALGFFFAAGAIIFAALFCMQTRIIKSRLEGANPNNKIESANIGFFSTSLKGLEIELPSGSKLGAASVEISHNFLPFCLILKKLNIESLKISGAFFEQKGDTCAPQPAGAAAISESAPAAAAPQTPPPAPRNFEAPKAETAAMESGHGFFSGFDLRIKNLEADLECRLRGGVKIKAKIGGENPARDIAAADLFKLYSANLSVPAEIESGAEKFGAHLRLAAHGSKKECKISSTLELEGKEIFSAEIGARNFHKNFDAQAQIKFDTADLKSLGQHAPQASLNLHAKASFDAGLENASLDASMRADTKNLREISVYLEEAETAALAAEISASKSGRELCVKNFAAGLGINGRQVCSAKNAKDFKLDISDISKFPDDDLFYFSLNNFDIGMLNALARQGSFELSAAPVSASILVSKSGKTIEAKSVAPISARSLTVKRNGAALVNGASFSLFVSGFTDFKNTGAIAQISPSKQGSDFTATIEYNARQAGRSVILKAGGNPSPLFPRARECGVEKSEISAAAFFGKDSARLKDISLSLSGKNGENILSARSKKEIFIDFSKPAPAARDAEIELSSSDLPAEILTALLPEASADKIEFLAAIKILGSQNISAKISAAAKNFSYKTAEKNFIEKLNLELEAGADFSNSGLSVVVKEFRALENSTGILTSSGSAVFGFDFSAPPVFKSGEFEASASVPKLLQQPALKPFDNASSGMLEISATAPSPEKIEAKATISNLRSRGCADVLDKTTLDIGAALKDFRPQKIAAAFRIASTRGETKAAANAEIADIVKIEIASPRIVLEDAQTLLGAFQNKLPIQDAGEGKTKIIRPAILKNAPALPPQKQLHSAIKKKLLPHETEIEPAPAAAPSAPLADDAQIAEVKIEELPQIEEQAALPAWYFGKSWQAKISAKKIEKGGEAALENLELEIFADENSVKASNASALFYGAQSSLAAEVFHTQNSYELRNSNIKIKEIEVGRLLKRNGENKTFVEGKFDFAADFSGRAKTLEELPPRLQFTAKASTKGGKFHFLDRASDTWEMASAGAGLLRLGGAIFGGKVREAGGLADALDMLADLEFSEAELGMERGENLDIILSPAEVKAADASLKIQGKIFYIEGEDIKNMPLSMPIKLDAIGGRLAQILAKLGYQKSGSGAVSGPQFNITGSLSNPKNNIPEILSAAARSFLKSKN